MAKKAFIDLDRVLFNADEFKDEKYFEHLASFLGVNGTRVVPETYVASRGDGFYNVDRHIALMSAASSIPAFDIRKKVESFMRREAQKFIYLDAELFLEHLAKMGCEIWIATAGIDWFQEDKIPVDFYRHIAGVKVTQDETKVSVIGRFADPEKDEVMLFDDSRIVINTVKRFFPRVCAIQVTRRDGQALSGIADHYADNLEEAFRFALHHFSTK